MGTESAAEESEQHAAHEEPSGPYFYYRDHSHLPDPDPTKPVTIPGRIPTFPAKLFAILSRPELADIISWMPHGRSWKVHKPREFEVKVIPSYFDHAKFSSFIRQANGWGFKRVCTKGVDRNSHYHELFLRGMPHLIKFMKRPVSGSKVTNLPQHAKGKNCDPDFYKISDEHPLPEFSPKMLHPLDESSFLNSANNKSAMGNSGADSGRPQLTNQFQSLTSLHLPSSSGQTEQMTQLQSFFAQQESLNQAPAITEQNIAVVPQSKPFLLPRMAGSQLPQMVTSAPQQQADHCPVRHEEKELDPLTIFMNDLFDGEDASIDDPIINSLVSDPTVPPPSSLNRSPTPPVYEPKVVYSQHSIYNRHVVSPVEDKHLVGIPEPAYVNTQQLHSGTAGVDDDLCFEDPFAGGLLAENFF